VERQERAALQDHLTRLADGDRAAFRPVFDLAWPRVREIARRMLPGPADVDDAAQVALLKVFERASEFDPTRDALAWIVGVVTHECLTIRRKATRRRESGADQLAAIADSRPTPEDCTSVAELEQAALAMLGQLSCVDQETLRAAIFDEGERTARPATFRKRVERALTRLRAAWREHGIG
jgi:RNA polymerase sigma-70 factor (ECF subfamily)